MSLSKLKACGRRQASASNVRAKVADEIALRDFSVRVVRGELEELPEWLGLLMGGRDDMELMHFGQRGRRGRLSPVKKKLVIRYILLDLRGKVSFTFGFLYESRSQTRVLL